MAEKITSASNVPAVGNSKEISYVTSNGDTVVLSEAAVRAITNNNKDITSGEIELFIETAKYMRLNPYLKEIFAVKYDNTKPCQTIVARSAMMKIAEEHPAYDGIEDGIIVQNKNGEVIDRDGYIMYLGETLLGGWAKVWRKDRTRPFTSRLDIKEYSKQQSTWRSMEKTMIAKCATVAALRKAFPIQLSGMYTADELGSGEASDTNIGANIQTQQTNTDKVYDIIDNEPNAPVDNVVSSQPINDPTPQDFIEDDTADGEKIYTVKYGVYRNNTDKYEKIDGTYDKANGTIQVKLRALLA